MQDTSRRHLERLSHPETLRALQELKFDWNDYDRQVCGSLLFKYRYPQVPVFVGIVGGASSGKSTLFNTLLHSSASRISAHAHETLGPLAAVPRDWVERILAWLSEGILYGDLAGNVLPDGESSMGSIREVILVPHDVDALCSAILVDTPDMTSSMAAEEGMLTQRMLPWFDRLIIVIDEERWFDAAVLKELRQKISTLGLEFFLVFNRTESGDDFVEEQQQSLSHHAQQLGAAAWCISPFCRGLGYRPLADPVRMQALAFIQSPPSTRSLESRAHCVHRRCGEILQENVDRSDAFGALTRAVQEELSRQQSQTHLTTDLLTQEERSLLGFGHRFVPLYDVLRSVRKRLSALWGVRAKSSEIDFDKRLTELSEVLQRNFEHRFRHITDRIDRLIGNHPYVRDHDVSWQVDWTVPSFDAQAWAGRIRSHIDAWKSEQASRSRQSDWAAALVGTPLLVADLLVLGGAGMTLTWTAASIAGFFGGKSVFSLAQRSDAFRQYQTTVRAYQALVYESLSEQWQVHLDRMPRCHLKMSDPIAEALMHWSAPTRR